MQKHFDITRRRIQQFASESGLLGKLYTERAPIKLWVYAAPDRIPYEEALRGEYRPAHVGERFGPLWSTHWFRAEIDIPEAWQKHEVHLLWDSVSEALIYMDGQPAQALTGADWTGRPVRGAFRLPNTNSLRTLYIEMACNHLFGVGAMGNVRETYFIGWLRQAEIALFDREAWDLLWDFKIIADMAEHLPNDSVRGRQALFIANEIVNACDLDDRRTWPKARAIAARFLAQRNGDSQHNLSGVGHAHIDTAWLWPLAETKRKVIRTVATTLRLIEDYPEYKFAFSQAQQYEWIKQLQPALYEKLKACVTAGRIVPVGGMWVEPDTNVPSGESLVRHLLLGQRFFQREFGITCRELWIPDVFGYCAQLPQIGRLAGIHYFLTQKLSWNQINKPQSHTFWWEGLDGSRLLTHFPPADTYNAMVTVEELLYNVRNFKDLERANESYMLFGYGDGGSGPTPEMLERGRRMRDVDGLPRFAIRSSQEFFERCEADAKDLTTQVGELYFELHRGTYTTQARTKKNNRKSELLLRDVEFIAAAHHALRMTTDSRRKMTNRSSVVRPRVRGDSSSLYPSEELDRLWKIVLLNQFHDILPGSSIHEVYEDSHAQFTDLLASGTRLRDGAVEVLKASLADNSPRQNSSARLFVINTLSHPRTEVVELPADVANPVQVGANGKPLSIASAPSMGWRIEDSAGGVARNKQFGAVKARKSNGTFTLDNDLVRAIFHEDGALVSLIHRPTNRECIAEGAQANHFVLFDDNPADWDAWDVDAFHLEKRYDVSGAKSARLIERGPLRAAIEFTHDLSPHSTLKQIVSLTAVSPRLDFATEVDWCESHRFLKVEFPLNVRAPNATYDVQFGLLQRPTHFNTSYDLARFEVCAHKWADLSETSFGVALLNDCKYGYATHGNVMRLSLLRSPKFPDEQADMGQHGFSYALLPHAGAPQEAGVIDAGYDFNVPLIVQSIEVAAQEVSLLSVDAPNVVIEAVKKAEDSDALIVRLFEAHGARGPVTVHSSLPIKSLWRCNLLEEEEEKLLWKNGVTLNIKPFQIVTLKLKL